MATRTAHSEGFRGRGSLLYGLPFVVVCVWVLFLKDYSRWNRFERLFYTIFEITVVPTTIGLLLDWGLRWCTGGKSSKRPGTPFKGGPSQGARGGMMAGSHARSVAAPEEPSGLRSSQNSSATMVVDATGPAGDAAAAMHQRHAVPAEEYTAGAKDL
jgi:hypothetical protein